MVQSKQKKWVFLLIVILTSAAIFTYRNSTLPTLYLLSQDEPSPLQLNSVKINYEDLDALVVKPVMAVARTVTWSRSQAGPAPYNSVEHDKTNVTSPYSEEFTIVLLTNHNRILDLPKMLEHLRGLQRLKRVIVIWNGEKSADEIWIPKLNFRVKVLTNGRNSLNNRFLPLQIIETDAILSMDDDMFPSHDSIIFAFRIWQEFRDRIVGFPGRGVVWSEGRWKYDAHPCSTSMVLTGLAFFHKKYLNLYTHEMPSVIRDRVDNVTNCEDIAMNFLVSHLTQLPPIKVTPTNAWVCPGCDSAETGKNALWKDPKHFEERDSCINYFSKIYGYTPLFKSEYRLDDIFDNNRLVCNRLNKIPVTKTYVSISASRTFLYFAVVSFAVLLLYFISFPCKY